MRSYHRVSFLVESLKNEIEAQIIAAHIATVRTARQFTYLALSALRCSYRAQWATKSSTLQ